VLYTTAHYQQSWSTNELMKKNELISMWRFQFHFEWKYWMTLHTNWIEFQFNLNLSKLSPNTFNSTKFNSNLIEEKWNANWWKKCWKSACGYGVKKCLKKKNMDLKRHNFTPLFLGMHTSLPGNALNRFQFGGV